ncbi:hypothetical protein Dimus_006017, partial [Dionaea muscipula]
PRDRSGSSSEETHIVEEGFRFTRSRTSQELFAQMSRSKREPRSARAPHDNEKPKGFDNASPRNRWPVATPIARPLLLPPCDNFCLSAGLRTLCLAYRNLSANMYESWNEKFMLAKSSVRDREKKLDE